MFFLFFFPLACFFFFFRVGEKSTRGQANHASIASAHKLRSHPQPRWGREDYASRRKGVDIC